MLKFLLAKPDIDTYHYLVNQGSMSLRPASTLLAATLSGLLFLTGCQQQAESPSVADNAQTTEQTASEDSKPMPQSDSATASIEQFQPIYLAQAQGLQRRLQAEYESLQAADTSAMQDSLLLNKSSDTSNDENKVNSVDNADSELTANDTSAMSSKNPEGSESVANAANDVDTATDINTSTEVGERDLTVLKRISLEPRKPVVLTDTQIIERYQQAMAALYQPVTTPISAENADTLINIATLVPQLFEHAEIAGRVSAKSPALARLIIQHQVWEQIEAQQVLDIQQMKLNQQQEFELLMSKFNETIKGYDEQIAKYEETLKAFK